MRFEELHETIPFARFGKEKSLTMKPYHGITLAMPGRHSEDTSPRGGDFVVMVTDKTVGWRNHQFTHTDIFNDVELKRNSEHIGFFMNQYLNVVCGDDPERISLGDGLTMPGINFDIFLHAAQCLAVAEHRRYARYENKFGGRFLPFRFAAGIAQELWDASDADALQKRGRPGVEYLEKVKGRPVLTQELIDAN